MGVLVESPLSFVSMRSSKSLLRLCCVADHRPKCPVGVSEAAQARCRSRYSRIGGDTLASATVQA